MSVVSESLQTSVMVEALKPGFSMGWDAILMFVPVILACWLFWPQRPRHIFWWPVLVLFVLFLPNAPYVYTDILHLVFKIRKEPHLPVWAVALLVLPQYLLYIFLGLQSYTISLMLLDNYVKRHWDRGVRRAVEFALHFLCAIGVYLGRALRLNSWDALRDPARVLEATVDAFDSRAAVVFVIVGFFVLLILYRVMSFFNLALYENFQNYQRERMASELAAQRSHETHHDQRDGEAGRERHRHRHRRRS